MKLSRLWAMIIDAARYWSADNASTLGAALAFYCAFSLAPLLVLLVTTVGWITGADAAYGYLAQQLTSLFGTSTSEVLINAARASQEKSGLIGTAVSIVSLLVGATNLVAVAIYLIGFLVILDDPDSLEEVVLWFHQASSLTMMSQNGAMLIGDEIKALLPRYFTVFFDEIRHIAPNLADVVLVGVPKASKKHLN